MDRSKFLRHLKMLLLRSISPPEPHRFDLSRQVLNPSWSHKDAPYDDLEHGTHVTGTMTGSEPDGSNQIGVFQDRNPGIFP
jgi:hypothetical protein